jgi:hypothetical protein
LDNDGEILFGQGAKTEPELIGIIVAHI